MIVTKNNAKNYVGKALLSYHPKFHYYPLWIMEAEENKFFVLDATQTITLLNDNDEIQFDIARDDIMHVQFCKGCEFYKNDDGYCFVMQRKMQKYDFCSHGIPKRSVKKDYDPDRPCPDYSINRLYD